MSEAERAMGGKRAGPKPLSRLFGPERRPLRLLAVPRDHVVGDRARGEALLAGRFAHGGECVAIDALDFPALGARGGLAAELHGFAWLRDVAATNQRERGARLAEVVVSRWLAAHGTRIDEAWQPELWGLRLLFWTAYAPLILSSQDSGYRSAVLNTMARGARYLDLQADRASPGLPRITAWAGAVAASLLVQGDVPRIARAESGLIRTLAAGQSDDGGLLSRSPAEQQLLVDRLALLRAAYFAAKQALPETLEAAAAASLAALHGVMLGDGGLSSWHGGNPGDPARLAALIDGCGLRARPLRAARGWGFQRLSALATTVIVDTAPPPPALMSGTGCASTLAFEMSDGAQRLIVNCGGRGLLPTSLSDGLAQALRTTAAHSTLVIADSNSTALNDQGGIGRGVRDVRLDRSEGPDGSRVEAAHDGYARRFGLLHQRRLLLSNDGKELLGSELLLPAGRRRAPAAEIAGEVRFHLSPGVEATATADGMGAILRSSGAPPWSFRCRGAPLAIEDSVAVSGRGELLPCRQLVIAGTIAGGVPIDWQLRRSS